MGSEPRGHCDSPGLAAPIHPLPPEVSYTSRMFLFAVLACNEAGVQSYNTAPLVAILAPEDGTVVDPGALVEFYGEAEDGQTVAADLQITWLSSLDGVLDTNVPDRNGDMTFATNSLSAGSHVITLSAVDTRGDSAETTVTLQVGDGSNVSGAPAIVIVNPSPGEQVGASQVINLLATVADDVDAPEVLPIEVLDNPDGVVWNGYAAPTGTLDVPFQAHSLGIHTLTVSALDLEGKLGSASVTYEVVQDEVPLVNISSPADGAWGDTIDIVTFRGNVLDDTTPNEQVVTSWTSDLQGLLSAAPPDSNGDTTFASTLFGGTHVITLTATDLEGNVGRDTLVVNVDDPLDRDDDGDGYSENAGDCDDTDDTLSPAEIDICDAVDQDCDGYINDPYWDTYEYNNLSALAYDLGEVDGGILWSGDSLEIAGLTFSDATDEDWFRWQADDELYDNVDIQIVVSGLSASGDFVVELYDDGGGLLNSDSGNGAIGADFTSDVLETGDDAFYVRIYALGWPTGSCSTSYKLKIKS